MLTILSVRLTVIPAPRFVSGGAAARQLHRRHADVASARLLRSERDAVWLDVAQGDAFVRAQNLVAAFLSAADGGEPQ